MNAHTLAQNAYVQTSSSTRTDRDTEYRVLARISHRLRAAAQEKGPKAFPKLAEALVENRTLWDTFAVDVAHPENGLPKELRAQIFALAQFVNAHTGKVLAREAKVGPLLEVNAAILKGLSAKGRTR
ncbi:flagellar biosynthesis regulator FlaF [Citreimonas salinaria]|uniref:Flagellar protein FlaF n=1 Tax=Citreimonas salinaria TaxID=321339 RepID=A0A1H3EXL9_9RHOB|nr:flagellar biosynthesis regulator FlaF [Citreimonas salinaria]SDX82719.1 flagellar protein FlaF [Citreimonas salinaria]